MSEVVKGILKAQEKDTKKGGKYFQCKVGEALVNVFPFQGSGYSEIAELQGKPVLLEYEITDKGKDFVSVQLDPDAPPAPPPEEQMGKTDWALKQNIEHRVDILKQVVRNETLGPMTEEIAIKVTKVCDIFWEWIIKITQGTYVEQVARPITTSTARPKAQRSVPEPDDITSMEFVAICAGMGFSDKAERRKGLGLRAGQTWTERKDYALDVLFQYAQARPEEYPLVAGLGSWRDFQKVQQETLL